MSDLFQYILYLQRELSNARIEQWRLETLPTWRWWFAVFVLLLSWAFFKLKASRERLMETWIVGFTVTTISILMDEMGLELVFWGYPNKLIPIFPHLVVADYAVLPVSYMLLFQRFRSWTNYILAVCCLALCFAFIAEPILVYMKFYTLVHWRHYYGIPLYILIGIAGKWAAERISAAARSSKR